MLFVGKLLKRRRDRLCLYSVPEDFGVVPAIVARHILAGFFAVLVLLRAVEGNNAAVALGNGQQLVRRYAFVLVSALDGKLGNDLRTAFVRIVIDCADLTYTPVRYSRSKICSSTAADAKVSAGTVTAVVVLQLTKGKIGNTLMMGVPIILSESEIFRKHPTFCSLVICWLHDCQTIGTSCLPDGLVRMRSAVRIRPAVPKSIESFGFRCFLL